MSRTVVWFSCGAASAVAARLTLASVPDAIIARCVVANEHPDNDRFAKDVAKWLGVEVVNLSSTKYRDCWDVWERRRFLNSPGGALCTVEMKKKVRQEFEDFEDLQVFGFTHEEQDRAARFRENNPETKTWFPLVEKRISKGDCYRILEAEGLTLPAMYRLGYHNANCVGCVKGGAGYWNKIRVEFPEVFERMAALEERIGATVLKEKSLRQLRPSEGRHEDLVLGDCGLFCGENEGTLAAALASVAPPEEPRPEDEGPWCGAAGPCDACCDLDKNHPGSHRGWSTEGRVDWAPGRAPRAGAEDKP